MDPKESGGVILTAYHSFAPAAHVEDERYGGPLPARRSPLARKVQYQAIGRMSSPGARPPPPPQHSPSRDSMDSMEDYWSEVKNIVEDGQGAGDELVERGSMDEAELEEDWLQEAGLSTLVSGPLVDGPAEALLSTLTRSQAAMVRKRLDNYTQTMRKRNKQPMRHVRDVFSTPDSSPVDPVPPVSPNGQIEPKLPHRTSSKGSHKSRTPDTLQHKKSSLKHNNTGHHSYTAGRSSRPVFPDEDRRVPESVPEQNILSFEVPYSEGVGSPRKGSDWQECQRIRKDDPDQPTFHIVKPKLGVTRVYDLSSEDMKKVGPFALIELTTFYDCLGIELKRNRIVRNKTRESGIFGVPLTTLLENDQKKLPGSRVPLVFKKLLSKLEQTGLQTEGILRVPGSASRVKHLRQELESKFYEDRFDWEQVRHNDAAGLLKMFIRELPHPLLTLQHLPAFTAAQNIISPRYQIQALHLLVMLLPEPNRDTLKALLEFLRKVVAHEEQNRMSLWNVSMIVAPNLFTYRGKNARQEEMQGAAGAANLVRLLITHQDLLWMVPCFLISHVRKMNEASAPKKTPSSEKSKRKLLKRWNTEREKERSEITDLREGVIRVHAPQHTKVSMAILLDKKTKAQDVMARFDIENGQGTTSRRHKQFLFEVGGNIGERCLDPETHLLNVYRVNPHCEWVLKQRTT
ncbi:rho GTPase-activating protein 28 isoform X6 [Denticeps clupeoides]|uniref:rho GTPase-activating protein 28 isoform X6 n=1 Tax=Denticeps clupeoides TaxID=299321 RepID=UPI0010A31450|nr:rho GTPase-activating protein 18-like isoform X6 [Denticeps clupeoides]